jgi:hypothetical protein
VAGFAIGTLAGKPVKLTVIRGGAETELSVNIGSRDAVNYALVSVATPTAQQSNIRAGWLKK